MRTLRRFYTGLAFSALLLSSNCTTSDSADTVDDLATADAGNQVVDVQKDQITDSEIPNPEQVAAETQQAAEAAGEAIDANSSNTIQELGAEQQAAAPKGPELPEGAVDDASTSQMAQHNKAAQPVSDIEPAAAAPAADTLPSLSQVVAESDTPAPAADAGRKPRKAQDSGMVAATDTTMDSAADAGMNSTGSAPKAHKHKARKSHGHAARRGADVDLSGNFYIVQPGDTLGQIATIIFGTSRRWQDLAQANGLSSNTPIYPGDILRYQADSASAEYETAYKNLPRSKAVVQKGDTLALIAERQMGNAAFWKLLWRWNQATISQPNRIFEGQSLEYIAPQEMAALLSDRKGLKQAH